MPDGKVTSFPIATQKKDDETVVFSWVIWPDRATRDAGWNAIVNSPDMKMDDMPFDGTRMMWVGFTEPVTARAD